jgi:hypothetical protein
LAASWGKNTIQSARGQDRSRRIERM